MDGARWLSNLYELLTCLYPLRYRERYRDELCFVFRQAAADAGQQGTLSLLRLAWRELRDLPGALLREHRRGRRADEMQNKGGSHGLGRHWGWRQLATCAPFIIVVFFLALTFLPLIQFVPVWVAAAVRIVILAFLVGLLLSGLVKGLPRWSLPTLGLALFIVTYLVDGGTGRLFAWFGLTYTRSPFTLQEKLTAAVVQSHLFLLPTLLVVLGLLAASFLMSGSWPFASLVRQDWSMLALIMYGWSLPEVIFYDAYNPEIQPYELAAVLILALGLWVSLRQATPARGWLALAAAVALQAIVLAAGIYRLYPGLPFGEHTLANHLWETSQPMLVAVFTIAWMSAPALMSLLPRPREVAAGQV